MNYIKSLLILLLMGCLTVMMSGKPLAAEEIDSLIGSESFYARETVKALIMEIIQAADEEIERTAEEAVKEAVIPLQADNFVLNTKIESLQLQLRQKDNRLYWIIPLSVLGGLTSGFMIGCLFF